MVIVVVCLGVGKFIFGLDFMWLCLIRYWMVSVIFLLEMSKFEIVM